MLTNNELARLYYAAEFEQRAMQEDLEKYNKNKEHYAEDIEFLTIEIEILEKLKNKLEQFL
jgi:hypothetical protein